ncbi:MAG: hypothetical protein PHN64_04805 [Desulfovibrionaceae bacterium]|nr:hypothetical protein [Desulfovibrionaceae bacterium]
MNSREKKLLAVLVVVAVLAAADRLWEFSQKGISAPDADKVMADARTAATNTAAAVSALPLKTGEQYALFGAQRTAVQNPFIPALNIAVPDAAASGAASGGALQYTGYIAVGSRLLAIIGGMEYAVGDAIPSTGDVVRAISGTAVRLFSPSKNAEWELTYSGDDF